MDSTQKHQDDVVHEDADEGTVEAVDEEGYDAAAPDEEGNDVETDRAGDAEDADEAE